MNRELKTVIVTGGAGFVGSNFIRRVLSLHDFEGVIVNLDKLTYAGNLMSLSDIVQLHGGRRYHFEKVDICDVAMVREVLNRYQPDTIVHFAAESHVDRSIHGSRDFINTNIVGTYNLLEESRAIWRDRDDVHFHHVSTDEVYGSLEEQGYFTESSRYDPKSPYSASKAASDHLVRAFNHTYGIPATISNCSNNYGPYQFPEKLIPLMIWNMVEEKPLPVYGDGRNIRDWLHVVDHADAIWTILTRGRSGETYNIGGGNEWENIKLVEVLCEMMSKYKCRSKNYYKRLITFVIDRPGHDRRYAIDFKKISIGLGWKPATDFAEGLENTLQWYLQNSDWVSSVMTGQYRQWLDFHYKKADA